MTQQIKSKKQSGVKRLAKETLIYGTSTIAARLFNFFLVPVYTYYLITADYGIIATVFAFMALFNIIYQARDKEVLGFDLLKDNQMIYNVYLKQ